MNILDRMFYSQYSILFNNFAILWTVIYLLRQWVLEFVVPRVSRPFSMFCHLCVVVLASYMLVGPIFLLNYITWLLWRPHKLLLSNYNPYLGSCKWQPPQSPFASALVMDWYQYSGCHATHARGATL